MSVLLLLKCLIICSLMYTCPVLERQIARYYIKIYLQTFGHGEIVITSVNVLLVEILMWTWIVMMTLLCVLAISLVTFHSHARCDDLFPSQKRHMFVRALDHCSCIDYMLISAVNDAEHFMVIDPSINFFQIFNGG